MIRTILIHPDPRLKKPCEAVATVTPELRALADDMLETMYEAPGVGLAAPQIGVMQRIITMDCIKDGPPEPMVLLNPRVIWSSEDVNVYEEGCLSIPDQYAEVKRPASVTVEWMDLDGATQERTFTGLWATCVQHEIDHLDGKLFIDYLGPLKRQMITRKMEKLKRERARMGE
jgi:peptide deformylase